MIEIDEVRDLRGRRRFVQFQFDLYRHDPNWVPPLIRDEVAALDVERNPGLDGCELRCWLAVRDGNCLGRVAGVINSRDNEMRGMRAARFCLFDCVDEAEVSGLLIGAVESWARGAGMEQLEGPLGLTTFERSAVLIEGFDRLPTAVSSYNFPYYAEHLEGLGFEKQVDYVEHRFRLPDRLDSKYEKIAEYVLKRKRLHLVEKTSRKQLMPLAREIFHLINAAYSGLYEFTPLGDPEIDALIKKFFAFIDPRFVKLVGDESGKLVAVGAAMPSLSRGLQAARGRLWPFGLFRFVRAMRRNRTLDLYLVAVDPPLQNAGLNAIVMHEMHKQAIAGDFEWVETNGELETNGPVLSMWKDIDHETHKRRRIYRKSL